MFVSAVLFTVAEKEDLVNLLMRHAGNSSNSTPRSEFASCPGSQADMQTRDLSYGRSLQEQSVFTAAHLSAQRSPSTARTLRNNDDLVSSLYMNTRYSGRSNCYLSLTASFCIDMFV
jgi:hypothetical protein